MRWRSAATLVAVLIATIAPSQAPARAVEYETTAESSACGFPRAYLPRTGRSGSLPDSHLVRGPAGALFGRSLGQVRDDLVWWTVPMSGGFQVQVHRRLLPALAQVRANLEEQAELGRWYEVRPEATSAYSARTSTSHDGISFHGMGAAIDINSDRNPYRLDGTLVTDIPQWFVTAWEEAGMCWGGGWRFTKDPMHFSWSGPASTPGFTTLPPPYAPLTADRSFSERVAGHGVVFGADAGHPRLVAEASGDGAPDVVQVRPWRDGTILEAATSRGSYLACGIRRWFIDEQPSGTPEMADIAGVGRADLVYVDETGPTLTIRRYHSNTGFEVAPTITTAVPAGSGQHVFGDADGDGADDLWIVADTGDGVVIEVWSAASGFAEMIRDGSVDVADSGDPWRLATADRTVDGRDDLLLIDAGAGASTIHVVDSAQPSQLAETVSGPGLESDDEIAFEDYDGDGRPDLEVLSPEGGLSIWLGNSPLPAVSANDWFVADDFECPPDTVPYHYLGLFADDDESEFSADIEWLARRDVTRGCNPPFNDRFCPDSVVTRGEMAAFLVRALALPAAEARFSDASGSVFEADIASLAAAGITKGCDPPANSRFCPDDPVTRGQMAAFLDRALSLASSPVGFEDAAGSVFAGNIGALAGAGITRGCNPPANDRFCPDRSVTRGQMAAFLHRARAWLPEP